MIEANKYLNLDTSVIYVSSKIINKLQKDDIVKYNELLSSIENQIGKDAQRVYTPSLSFLFLLGKIEYLEDLDAFQLKDETK